MGRAVPPSPGGPDRRPARRIPSRTPSRAFEPGELPPDSPWRHLRTPTGGEEPPLRLPETPFGRFAFAHAVCAAGDTLVTIALAGSLFFNVSLGAARGQVLKYLLISLTPFLILSPLIGPLIDRFAGGRRWIVVISAAARAIICLFMAGDLKGLLLFPEAFAVLVLSKTYAVARSALVPAVVEHDDELVRANSRLSLITGLSGFAIVLPGGVVSKVLGSGAVLWFAAFVFIGAALAAVRIITVRSHLVPTVAGQGELPEESGPGEAPVRQHAAAQRARERVAASSIRMGGAAMAMLRGEVGFMTFLVAFTFKDEKVSKVWYAFVLAASAAGALIGASIAARLRRSFGEDKMVVGSVGLVAVTSALGIFRPDPGVTCLVAAAVGLAAATARVAFDALVQRDGPHGERGSTFARFETRFQLVWVLGALLAIAPWDRFLGFALMAGAAAATIATYVKGEPALQRMSDVWTNATSGITRRIKKLLARRGPDPLGDPFSDT